MNYSNQPTSLQGGKLLSYATEAMAPNPHPISEIDREFARLSNANERLAHQISTLWTRLNSVTVPPAPSATDKCGEVSAVVNSALGNQLRSQALNAEEMERSVGSLLQALCI